MLFPVLALGQIGPRDVTVTTPSGTATMQSGFSVTAAAPTIASIAPAAGNQGQTVDVVISGTGLDTGVSASFGAGTSAIINAKTFTTMNVSVNIAASAVTGARNVTVTGPGGVSNTLTAAFQVRPPAPVISTISPISGVQGTVVTATITGQNLLNATVSFGPGIQVEVLPGGTATTMQVRLTIQGPIAYAPCLETPLYKEKPPMMAASCTTLFGFSELGRGWSQGTALVDAKANSIKPFQPPGSKG